MSAHNYAVTTDETLPLPTRDGVLSAIVVAESSADAIALLESLHGDTLRWGSATVTELVAATDLTGWTLKIDILAPADVSGSAVVIGSVSVVGVADDTVDTMATEAATALNAGGFGVANASYNASTNVLTVAGTADNLGANRLVVYFHPAGDGIEKKTVPGFVGAITHEGSAGAALTVALAADSYTVPNLTAKFKPSTGA